MLTERMSSNEVRAIWHLQKAILSAELQSDSHAALHHAERIRRIMQAAGATEPERLARALDRVAQTLES